MRTILLVSFLSAFLPLGASAQTCPTPTTAPATSPSLNITIDQSRLTAYGLTLDDVNKAIEKFSRDHAGQVTAPNDLLSILLTTPSGATVSLQSVVKMTIIPTTNP